FSRGVWMAMVISGIAIFHVARRHFSLRTMVLSLGLPLVACTALLTTTSLFDKLGERFERVSAEDVYADGRWEHWKEGLRSARDYLALGSGLGTYGYATLADQQQNSKLWFREAHNQYLETVAEQGIPGILIAIMGLVLMMRCSAQLLNHPRSRERSSIGFLGLFTTTAIATQSMIDFVILIPGVMFSIAAVVGVVSQASVASLPPQGPRISPRHSRWTTVHLKRSFPPESKAWFSTPGPWLIAIFVLLLWTQSSYHRQRIAEQVAEHTRILADDYQPTQAEVEANLEQLTQCVSDTGDRPELYQRRSHWHLTKFRIALQQAAQASGTPMSWESTSPDALFQTLMSMSVAQREWVIDDLINSAALREPLDAAFQDLGKSIAINPLVPQVYLQATLIAPLCKVDFHPFLDNFVRLSRNSSQFQFAAGLIAYHIDDADLMLEQWAQALRMPTTEFDQMVRLARHRVGFADLINRLVPGDRMELMLPMIRSLSHEDQVRIRSDEQWMDSIQTRVRSDSTLTTGQQHAALAGIAEVLERHEWAVSHWSSAVKAEGKNADFRFRYCQSLLKQGDIAGAVKQASLGQSLEPESERFKNITESALKRDRGPGR
ncbi:MAG: O-antigen ligase family protein, partial [Novipirellula sp. JB048]